MKRISVPLGKRFGLLEVIGRAPNDKNGRSVFACRCRCSPDKTILVSWNSLRSNNTKSCGCLKKITGVQNARKHWMQPPGHAARNIVYKNYIRDAKRFNRVFEISFEDFCRLTQLPCHYCGSPPATVSANSKFVNGQWTYNGLDRIDNAKPYTMENVVPCCATCNRAKLNLTVEEFLARIKSIAEHLSARNWQIAPEFLAV